MQFESALHWVTCEQHELAVHAPQAVDVSTPVHVAVEPELLEELLVAPSFLPASVVPPELEELLDPPPSVVRPPRAAFTQSSIAVHAFEAHCCASDRVASL